MPDSGKMNYPGEEGHYNQDLPNTIYPNPGYASTQNFGQGPLGGKLPGKPPEKRNIWKRATLILLITTLVFLATTVLAFTHSSTSTTPKTSVASTAVPTQSIQPTPAAPAATVAPTSASTPSSTPVAPGSLTPVPDGVIQENITLTCGGCDDPIRVTINSVRVDSANGRMIWDNTLKDISGNDVGYSINTYTLQDSTDQTPAIPAVFAQGSGNLVSNIPSDIQGVFAFVPSRNITYILTVVVYAYSGVTITFDPVKITF
jgi:hypothetical protein